MFASVALFAALTTSTTPDPYAIFGRARSVWEQARYPRYMRYDVLVSVTDAGKVKTNTYPAVYFAKTNRLIVDDVSLEQRAHPHVPPSGVNFFDLFAVGGPLHDEPVDYIGVPQVAPNYSFGMATYVPPAPLTPMQLVAEIRKEFHDPNPRVAQAVADEKKLHVIASVKAVKREYTIVYDGLERIAGHDDYHLTLSPLRNPWKYRLRQLWIDDATYFTDRLVSAGNFVTAPYDKIPWTVDFTQVDGAPVIASESTPEVLRMGGRDYSDVSIAVTQVQTPAFLPQYLDFYQGSGPDLNEP